MSVSNAIRIDDVKYSGEFALRLRWTNGKRFSVDLREIVFRLKGLRPLRESASFSLVRIGEGGHSIAWPGDLDIGADRLWELALEQNGHADAVEFNRWRWKHALSLSGAADALGLSRRQIAYYASGERPVPRTVLLACKGWEAELNTA